MNNILAVSDLHTDINTRLPKLPPADILILAGDTSQSESLAPTITQFCSQYQHVIFVAGNHEYYESTLEITHERIQNLTAKLPNLHWLQNQTITLNNQRFIGTTMWFPQSVTTDIESIYFSDFHCIKNFRQWVYQENLKAQNFLNQTVQNTDIVITHHIPSAQSISILYKTSPLNVFYICNMEKLIKKAKPKLWIHGHIHTHQDYQLHSTRILANPFGYESRCETWAFNPTIIIP